MRTWTVVLLLLTAGARVVAEEPKAAPPGGTDPKDALRRVVEAMAKVQVVSYEVEYAVSGWFSMFLPNIQGTVVIGKESTPKSPKFRSTLKIKAGGSGEAGEANAGSDGTTYYVVDATTKTVHADIDPGVLGKSQWPVEFTLIREFAEAKPFEEVFTLGRVEPAESQTIDGEPCEALKVYSPSSPGATWYFSQKDHLPRRVTYTAENEKGEPARADMTLHKLTVNPQFVKNPFEIVVPEGYTKTDEFAP